MNELKIVALDFDGALYDNSYECFYNTAKLKQVLQAIHAANIYLCIVDKRKYNKILAKLDEELGKDRPYLNKQDIWTVETMLMQDDLTKDDEIGSRRDVILSFAVRRYNKKNIIPAKKADVLYTSGTPEFCDVVEKAGYRVLRFQFDKDAKGCLRPEAAFLDNLCKAVIGKPLVPSLGASSHGIHAKPAARNLPKSEEIALLPRKEKAEEDNCCRPCVLI